MRAGDQLGERGRDDVEVAAALAQRGEAAPS
jgi:hypothetical protein